MDANGVLEGLLPKVITNVLVVKSPRLIEVDANGVLEGLLPKVITNVKTRKRKFYTFLFSFSSNADESN